MIVMCTLIVVVFTIFNFLDNRRVRLLMEDLDEKLEELLERLDAHEMPSDQLDLHRMRDDSSAF